MGQLQPRGSEWQDPAAALDQVISQSHEEGQCLLYKLANYKKGGELMDAYRLGGGREVEKLILEQFSVFMYNEGRGKEITRTEYLKWKLRGKTRDECALNMEPGEKSRFDPLNFWHDHEACWQMQYRGNLGETLLHVLIICNTRTHSRIAKILLKCFPKLAVDVVEGQEYLGASALHLAIAYNNNELATQLIECNAKVDQRAIGSFFLPRDQQREVPRAQTDFEGLAYLGETLLNWAACCNNESCYNMLVDRDADPNAKDSFGNMVLHMIVVCDKQGEGQSEEMFGYALRHPRCPARNGELNGAGLTPLTLACRLARSEIFREMLELTCVEFWRYSNITCSAYPLNALDTIGPDGKTNWNSALMMILNGKKEEHLDMLEGGIIQRLLEEKWQSFARAEFLRKLMIMMLHLVSISVAMYLRPEFDHTLMGTNGNDIARYCFETTTLLGCLYYLMVQSGSEIKNQGLVPFIIQLFHDPIQLLFNISNVILLSCIPLRLLEMRAIEELVLTIAVVGSWFHLMFFAGAIQLTGPFVTMVFKIITNDMVTFFIIYSIFLLAFSQAFFFLYKGSSTRATSKFATYIDTWMGLFHMTLGDYDFGELSRSTYAPLMLITFVLFMVLVPILLLNMLIAMMGNTYATVVQQSEKEWVKQWANIVITLERGIGSEKCKANLESYSLPLPGADSRRGVVVIKSKSKTRARQRKGALTNWKRVGRVTLNALKRRRISGEMLRKEMWGLESIHTTPVKHAKGRKGRPPAPASMTPGGANVLRSLGGEPSALNGGLTSALDQLALACPALDPATSSGSLNGFSPAVLLGGTGDHLSVAIPTTGAPGGGSGGGHTSHSAQGVHGGHGGSGGHDNPAFSCSASSEDELPALFARAATRTPSPPAPPSPPSRRPRDLLTVPSDPFEGQVLESYRQLRSERLSAAAAAGGGGGGVRLPPIGRGGGGKSVSECRPALIEEVPPAPLRPQATAAINYAPLTLQVPPLGGVTAAVSAERRPPPPAEETEMTPASGPTGAAGGRALPAIKVQGDGVRWALGGETSTPPSGQAERQEKPGSRPNRPSSAAFTRGRGRVRNINAIVPWEDEQV